MSLTFNEIFLKILPQYAFWVDLLKIFESDWCDLETMPNNWTDLGRITWFTVIPKRHYSGCPPIWDVGSLMSSNVGNKELPWQTKLQTYSNFDNSLILVQITAGVLCLFWMDFRTSTVNWIYRSTHFEYGLTSCFHDRYRW